MIFEDEHLLVVAKPAGMNTHAPAPFAGEGIYDWLKHREPRWADLAIHHRLDKETSGVMVFGKTALANRSLAAQFAKRGVRKTYLLLTDHMPKARELTVKSKISRAGERYRSGGEGEPAETRFRVVDPAFPDPPGVLIVAHPLTGRTHQIRVHASESGFPILGDALYNGSSAPRMYLHATELVLRSPATGETMAFRSPADFKCEARLALRAAFNDLEITNALRLIHGAGDARPGWYVDRLGDYLLSQSEGQPSAAQLDELRRLMHALGARGAYHKIASRQGSGTARASVLPQRVLGEEAGGPFTIRENGASFELNSNEGASVGLFLDQRDNRRRFLVKHIAANFPLLGSPPTAKVEGRRMKAEGRGERGEGRGMKDEGRGMKAEIAGGNSQATPAPIETREFRVLNAFAYTCGFSVCAALAGARTTSVDLSRKHLEWGKRNFALNGLNPGEHEFIQGDVFDWLRRMAKRGRKFDALILDPPTFSQSKEHGVFRAEKDYGALVKAALPTIISGGVLLASTNAADWAPGEFVTAIEKAIGAAGREIAQRHYAPQPPDFPINRAEPAYLKTLWLRIT